MDCSKDDVLSYHQSYSVINTFWELLLSATLQTAVRFGMPYAVAIDLSDFVWCWLQFAFAKPDHVGVYVCICLGFLF